MMAFGLTFMACYSPVGACVTLSMKTTVAIIALYRIVYGAGRDTCAGGASYTATRGRHGAAVQCSHGRRRGVRPAIRHTTSHKDSIMAQLEKVLYTGKTHTTGGRDGHSRSSDGRLDVTLSSPGGKGAGTNPEQLFAAGWSACFIGAMGLAAGKMKVALPADLAVDAEVDLCKTDGAFFLQARLNVSLPGLEHEVAKAPTDAAHQTCPYSKAI